MIKKKLKSELFYPVFKFFGNEVKAFLWFNTENPLLGDCKPITMILKGREEKLKKFIKACLKESEKK